MSIDLDGLEGKTSLTKQLLSGFPGMVYCGLSVRGNGLFCIVKIENPERYYEHLEAAFDDLKELSLRPDPACKDIARLRFVSYDPDPIINFDVEPYRKIKVAPPQRFISNTNHNSGAIAERVERCLAQIETRELDLTENYRDWISLAYALGNEFGEQGRPYFHRVSQYYPKYNPREADRVFTSCLRGSATRIGTFFWHCRNHAIRW